MIERADVAIVGGGINGCALAYELSRRGAEVAVVERRSLTSGATGRCGAGVRQQWSARENVTLAMQSVEIFEQLSQDLGADIGFRQGGYLIAVHDEEDLRQAEKNVAMQRSLGLEVDILSPHEVTEIVPILDVEGMRAIGATFCPTDGHADPFKTTYAYAEAARRQGAHFYRFTTVTDILTDQGSVTGVRTDRGDLSVPVVVNAAGAWSKQIAAMAGVEVPNVPYKKEIIVTERMARVFDAMVISFRDGIYFSQQDEGQVLGGIPPPETVTGYHLEPTFSFLQHMAATLARYAPVLSHINVIRQWTGFYDVTPDARPILGPVEGLEGFIQCHGFSGHGFMLAPMVARLLADLIVDGAGSPILESLNLARFEDMDIEQEHSVVG
ncbi:MAG: FAD-binding oxidoreductase [Candidatus Thermoplasmatota archaeon]|nr:FAD-binding oxidoreductase [Candidatus Thermoplasmatota archaeon]